eukprot:TRINITY_DN22493_c0_g1_i1.p1 TRINITY_DN22493_c0_g1~~TRINITY_DN22493_c0_g1_i1.p1  ORF type:complete len:402 (+),score=75.17 TRINITY_DN22493_c0_g1_i1:151-1356(+)
MLYRGSTYLAGPVSQTVVSKRFAPVGLVKAVARELGYREPLPARLLLRDSDLSKLLPVYEVMGKLINSRVMACPSAIAVSETSDENKIKTGLDLISNDVCCVVGPDDYATKLLECTNIPFTEIKNISSQALDPSQCLIVESNPFDFTEKESEYVHDFVYKGGCLVTSNYSIKLVQKAFPGHLQLPKEMANPLLSAASVVEVEVPETAKDVHFLAAMSNEPTDYPLCVTFLGNFQWVYVKNKKKVEVLLQIKQSSERRKHARLMGITSNGLIFKIPYGHGVIYHSVIPFFFTAYPDPPIVEKSREELVESYLIHKKISPELLFEYESALNISERAVFSYYKVRLMMIMQEFLSRIVIDHKRKQLSARVICSPEEVARAREPVKVVEKKANYTSRRSKGNPLW